MVVHRDDLPSVKNRIRRLLGQDQALSRQDGTHYYRNLPNPSVFHNSPPNVVVGCFNKNKLAEQDAAPA
jgi:hypothetical protein